MDRHRPLGDLNDIYALDGPPADQSEGLDEDAILIGADGRPPGLQQGDIVVGEAGRCHGRQQPIDGAGDPGGRAEYRSQRSTYVDGKVDVFAHIGDRVATGISLVQGCAHVKPMPGLAREVQVGAAESLNSTRCSETGSRARITVRRSWRHLAAGGPQNENGARKGPAQSVSNGLRRYLIFDSLNSTCLRATGSYFFLTSLSVMVREFFLAT